jgi:hypothetical protein
MSGKEKMNEPRVSAWPAHLPEGGTRMQRVADRMIAIQATIDRLLLELEAAKADLATEEREAIFLAAKDWSDKEIMAARVAANKINSLK